MCPTGVFAHYEPKMNDKGKWAVPVDNPNTGTDVTDTKLVDDVKTTDHDPKK